MEPNKTSLPEFLAGGGEMGELMRTRDWSMTPLGQPANWPQSLKTCIRIILTSRQPMFVWWGDDLINLYNDPYKSIVGGKHPEALGQPAREVWKEIWDQTGPRAAIAMQMNEGTYDEALLLIMERNGYPEETYYTFSYSPVPGDQGGTNGIICANTDDTQRIIGERHLRTLKDVGKNISDAKSEDDVYTKTIDTLKENPQDFPFACIYHIEEDGEIARMAGKTDPGLSDTVLPDYISFDSSFAKEWLMHEVVQSDKPMIVTDLRSKYGNLPSGPWQLSPDQALVIPVTQSGQRQSYAILIVGISPHRQLDEKYSSFFVLVKDQIASSLASVYAYEEARKQAEALLEIDRAKTAFFSNISHEFRTPLTLMLGPLEELLNQKNIFSNEQEVQLAAAHRNALRLLRLVNTLLDFSRIEADKMKGHFFPVDLASITIDLASSFRSAVENAHLQFNVNCAVLSSTAYVDRDMWEKIVLNLLSNAFKYTLEGSISISLEQQDNTAVLKVKDTGVGIPADELPYMFERFHRIRHTRGRTYEGTGIGLSLVKELVHLHQGVITVESEDGKGSTFIVAIPLGKEHLPETAVTEDDTSDYFVSHADMYVTEAMHLLYDQEQDNPAQAVPEVPAEEKAHILLVDDNADMRHYLERLLNKHYTVETAAHGKQALEKIADRVPELVISDIMMPEMDGIELLHHIKQNPETSSVPVIFLSARAGEEAKIEGYDIGADDYLIKPFSSRELLARVKAQIRINRLHQDAVEVLQHSSEELERKVEERTAELLRKNNELEQFAYIASHDLQEPLRKIRTFSELLQKSLETGAPVNNYFDKIQSSAIRMTDLIKDVLNYSRLSNIDDSFVDIDLNITLQDVRTDLELLIEQKKAMIVSEQLPVIKGIPSQLQQLFTNLLANSLKFSDKDPVIRISASTLSPEEVKLYPEFRSENAYIRLEFADNGIGFEQQFAERIFTIFQRLNERKVYAGTGIGLALCKKIVENHNGLISAKSTLNDGAIFTIILPGSL